MRRRRIWEPSRRRRSTSKQAAPSAAPTDADPYLSPEQVAGHPPIAVSDVFATGVLLYEMTTGTRPFSGATAAELSRAILSTVPVPVRRVNRRVPAALADADRACAGEGPAPPAGVGTGTPRRIARGTPPQRRALASRHVGLAPIRSRCRRPRSSLASGGVVGVVGRMDSHGAGARPQHGAPERHRQRHGRSGFPGHPAAGRRRLPGTVAVPRHRVRRAHARRAADDGVDRRDDADPRRRRRNCASVSVSRPCSRAASRRSARTR